MEVTIKSTRKITKFDTLKTYVFSKYRYVESRKLDLSVCKDTQYPKTWLDNMHGCYVKPVSTTTGIAHYINHEGELTKVLVMPQECCELETLNFRIKGEK
jgi:hypothetical protein